MAFRSAEGVPDLDAAVVVGYVSVAAAGRIAANECHPRGLLRAPRNAGPVDLYVATQSGKSDVW